VHIVAYVKRTIYQSGSSGPPVDKVLDEDRQQLRTEILEELKRTSDKIEGPISLVAAAQEPEAVHAFADANTMSHVVGTEDLLKASLQSTDLTTYKATTAGAIIATAEDARHHTYEATLPLSEQIDELCQDDKVQNGKLTLLYDRSATATPVLNRITDWNAYTRLIWDLSAIQSLMHIPDRVRDWDSLMEPDYQPQYEPDSPGLLTIKDRTEDDYVEQLKDGTPWGISGGCSTHTFRTSCESQQHRARFIRCRTC
jgi:hypothetical protein